MWFSLRPAKRRLISKHDIYVTTFGVTPCHGRVTFTIITDFLPVGTSVTHLGGSLWQLPTTVLVGAYCIHNRLVGICYCAMPRTINAYLICIKCFSRTIMLFNVYNGYGIRISFNLSVILIWEQKTICIYKSARGFFQRGCSEGLIFRFISVIGILGI